MLARALCKPCSDLPISFFRPHVNARFNWERELSLCRCADLIVPVYQLVALQVASRNGNGSCKSYEVLSWYSELHERRCGSKLQLESFLRCRFLHSTPFASINNTTRAMDSRAGAELPRVWQQKSQIFQQFQETGEYSAVKVPLKSLADEPDLENRFLHVSQSAKGQQLPRFYHICIRDGTPTRHVSGLVYDHNSCCLKISMVLSSNLCNSS
jgi:hypothetical protein